MSQPVNCYFIGGPKDGKTLASEGFRKDFLFTNEKLTPLQMDSKRISDAEKFDRYYLAAIPPDYREPKQAVYTHENLGQTEALLRAASARHKERTLLHECASLLKVCSVNPSSHASVHDRLALIREIEELLK